MHQIRLDAADVGRVRFGMSPVWEVCHAVRTLVDPQQRPYHLPWLDEIRPRLDDLDVGPLLAIQPLVGYTPDLLTPVPETHRVSVAEQIAQIRATPLARVEAELALTFTNRGGQPVSPQMRRLAAHPRAARARIADALAAAWQTLVEPYWPRIVDRLDDDIAHHSRLLAGRGLAAALSALSPAVSLRGRTIRVNTATRSLERHATGGRGLLLQPSVFSWPRTIVVDAVDYPIAVIYPARGVAALWRPVEAPSDHALGNLLGRSRAALLASVREPATTTTLAQRHGLAAATVSEHLATLAAAGLVTSRRSGRSVLYRTTPLGEELLGPPVIDAASPGAARARRAAPG